MLTQGVSALLAVLAMNMVVLPCAMAFGLEDHDCLHCPPAEQHEMAGHHHGHDEHAEVVRTPCAEAQSTCCDVEASSVDSRGGKLKVRDSADFEALPVADVAMHAVCVAPHCEPAAQPPDPPGAFPPRHKLFCVYLD